MISKLTKAVWEYDQQENSKLWVGIKSLAKAGKTDEVLRELGGIKSSNHLDSDEFACLLNVALTSSIGGGKTNTSLALLRYGADPAPYESLALRLAASLSQEAITLECIKRGANPTIGGNMILDLAITNKQLKVIRTLLCQFKDNPQKPSAKELINSSRKALETSMPSISKEILEILSTKELQQELQKNINDDSYMSKDIQNLAKDIITKRRKMSLASVLNLERATEVPI